MNVMSHADCDHAHDHCVVTASANVDRVAAQAHARLMRDAIAAWDAEWSA